MSQFIVYGKSNCTWCDRAKALLEMKGHSFSYRDINVSCHYEDFREQFPDAKTVPQIFDTEHFIRVGGYEDLRGYLS